MAETIEQKPAPDAENTQGTENAPHPQNAEQQAQSQLPVAQVQQSNTTDSNTQPQSQPETGKEQHANEHMEINKRITATEEKIKEIESKISALMEQINAVEHAHRELNETVKSASQYAQAILDNAFREKFSNASREIEKLNEKMSMLIDEVGAGEGLNVNKIPPTILEIVYQSTLDDVVNAILKQLGAEEGERAIYETLEDIRERTSGCELFRFDGRRIRTRDVAKSIERKLVSAKQIQTTYDELLKKLLEYVPGYKPKNFRAMIKLKSQEYSVDATIHLTTRIDNVEREMEIANSKIAEIETEVQHLKDMINETINIQNELKTHMDSALLQITMKLDNMNANLEGIIRTNEEQRNQTNARENALMERITTIEEKMGIVHEVPESEAVKEIPCEKSEKTEKMLGDDESFLYYSLESEKEIEEIKSTLSLMFSDEKIDELIHNLIERGMIERMEREGKVYLRQVKKEKEANDLGAMILNTMEDGFTFRKLQKKFPDVSKDELISTLDKLIEEGKIYVEGTERRKIYRIYGPEMGEKEHGGV